MICGQRLFRKLVPCCNYGKAAGGLHPIAVTSVTGTPSPTSPPLRIAAAADPVGRRAGQPEPAVVTILASGLPAPRRDRRRVPPAAAARRWARTRPGGRDPGSGRAGRGAVR